MFIMLDTYVHHCFVIVLLTVTSSQARPTPTRRENAEEQDQASSPAIQARRSSRDHAASPRDAA